MPIGVMLIPNRRLGKKVVWLKPRIIGDIETQRLLPQEQIRVGSPHLDKMDSQIAVTGFSVVSASL